jgi:hypothetical protein
MAFALVGAISAVILLGKVQDRQIAGLRNHADTSLAP